MGRRSYKLTEEREHAAGMVLSDLGSLVRGTSLGWDAHLISSSFISLPARAFFQLSTNPFAARTFSIRFSRVLPAPLIVSCQTPTATPLCFIKLQ